MLSLLFAVAFWLVIFVAAVGAVVWLGFLWLILDDFVHAAPAPVAPRPFDQEDPLEQAFALPAADPRRRVR